MVELVVHGGMFPVLVLTGLVTNVINMAVFFRQGLGDRINLCLFSLAVADAGYLLFLMCAKFYTLLSYANPQAGNYWQQRYLNTVLGIFYGFLNSSNAMTTLVAVERCICVVSPFRAKRYLKTKYMAIVIISIFVYVMGLYGVLNVKYVTVHIRDPDTNSNRYVSRLSDFYLDNKVVVDTLYNYLLTIAIPAISLVVVIVTTSITLHKLRVSLAFREEVAARQTSAERQEKAVTHMLATICCVYVICMMPSVTVAFVRNLMPDFLPTGKFCNAFKVTMAFVHTLEVANSSANFYIYFTGGTRYRTTLQSMCCCFGLDTARSHDRVTPQERSSSFSHKEEHTQTDTKTVGSMDTVVEHI